MVDMRDDKEREVTVWWVDSVRLHGLDQPIVYGGY